MFGIPGIRNKIDKTVRKDNITGSKSPIKMPTFLPPCTEGAGGSRRGRIYLEIAEKCSEFILS